MSQKSVIICFNYCNACYKLVKNLLSHLIYLKSKRSNIQYLNFICYFYWCATWSHDLREEIKNGAFENTVLKRIFGPKTEEMTGS